jgi:hypothetical protein
MKRLAPLLWIALACSLAGPADGTVSVEFQLGAIDLPPGSLGVLVADTGGNGFTPVSAATGTLLAAGQTLAGSDDKIIAVFSVGTLADWGGRKGYAALLPPMDYAALGVAEGQALIFHAFPDRTDGQTIRANEAAFSYRASNASELAGDMGFVLPADGGAYRLAAIADSSGGMADLSAFGPRLDLAYEGGAAIGTGDSIDFGPLPPGATATRTLRISNTGGAPLTGLSVSAIQNGSTAFQVGSLPATTIALGQSIVFSVSFSPSAPGPFGATLRLLSNDPRDNPRDVTLVGGGANRPPTISELGDLTTNEDTALTGIPLTIGDPDVPASQLSVTITSGNQGLVPDANLTISGTGAERSLSISPSLNQHGSALLTVSVSDGIDSVSDAFTLTVNPVNDPPTLSDIAHQTTNEDTATPAIAFTIGDVETSAGSLTVTGSSSNPTLVPGAGIVFGGAGANRTVTITPAANQSGAATITITVNDGGLTATDTFTLTVSPVNDSVQVAALLSKGNPVPGAGVDPRIPARAVYDLFYPPAIDADSHVAFRFRWRVGTAIGEGIQAGPAVVAATGQTAPGTLPTDTFSTFSDPQIVDGRVVFPAVTKAGVKGIYTDLGGAMARVTATGLTVPTPVGGKVASVKSIQLSDTAIHWMGGLVTGVGGVGSTSDTVLYRWTPTEGTQLVLREGQTLGSLGTYLKAFVSLTGADPVEGQSRFQLGGGILAHATFGNSTTGVLRAEPGAVELIARTGQTLGGVPSAPVLYTFGPPFGTASDWVGGLVRFRSSVAGVTSANALAIVSGTPGQDYVAIAARQGGAATDPAGNPLPGLIYKGFTDPVFSPEGDSTYLATISGSGVTTNTDSGIWTRPAGAASPRLIAREGSQAAQTPVGQRWVKFSSIVQPAGDIGPIFTAVLAGTGVTTANDVGLWGQDSEGDLNLLLREGAPLDGKFVRTFHVIKSVVGALGITRSFNDSGEIVAHVLYTNGTTGIVKITVP